MEVEVTLEPEDLRALKRCLLLYKASPAAGLVAVPLIVWSMFGCWCIGSVLPVTAAVGGDVALAAGATMFGYGAIGGAGCVWLYKRVLVIREANLIQDAVNRFANAPWQLSVSPAGVKVEAARFSAFYHWSYFPEVIQTGDHVFLRTGRYEAIIVPRRAFPTHQAFLTFAEACRRYFDGLEDPPREAAPAQSTGIKLQSDEFRHGLPNR